LSQKHLIAHARLEISIVFYPLKLILNLGLAPMLNSQIKIRKIMFRVGWIISIAFYLATAIVTAFQWFVPDHKLLICFNIFNEAFLEFVLVITTFPFVMLFFYKTNIQGEIIE